MSTIEKRNIKHKTLKFNARYLFSNKLPYDNFYAKRIPLLQSFKIALQNYNERKQNTPFWRIKKQSTFNIAECGVYVGAGLLGLAESARDASIPCTIHALDTFKGLPDLSDRDKSIAPEDAPYLKKTIFDDTSLEEVKKTLSLHGFVKDIHFHEGLFEKTLPLLPELKYDFVDIDCDLYDSHITCLRYFYPRMHKGGIIFFDDYHSPHYPMAKVAIDDFMEDKPESLLHLRFGEEEATNNTKTYIVKY